MEIIGRVLPNNLSVFLMPMEGARSITGAFVVKAGSKYETKKEQGISHFLEHMAFKGTKKRATANIISTEIASTGAENNAGTSEESILYFIKSSPIFKNMVYDVLSDTILNPLFEQQEINTEGKTIIEEINYYKSSPKDYVPTLWAQILYGNQPAGRSILGTEETVRSFKRDHFLEYLQQLYVGPNSAFVLAGNLEPVEREIEKVNLSFQGLSDQLPERTKLPVQEFQTEPNLLLLSKDIEQTWVCLGARGYSAQNKEKYAMELLRVILGEDMSSRMFTEVRERRGLAYAIQSMYDMQSDVGSFVTWAGLCSQKIIGALEVMLGEYRKITSEKVPDEELQKAKNFIRGRNDLYMENSMNVAFEATKNFVLTGKVFDPEEELKKYEAVTAEELQQVAKNVFKNENLNLAMIGPHKYDEIYKILRI